MFTRTIRLLAGTTALSFAAFAPADAQFGGLIKKAKEKVQQQAEPSKPARPSEAFGPELTEETLGAMLKGLAAEDQQLTKRDEINKERQRLSSERNTLTEKNSKEQEQWRNASDKTRSCQSTAFSRLHQAHEKAQEEKMQSLAGDQPRLVEFMKQYQKVQERSAALMAKKDTTAAFRLQNEFMQKFVGIDLHADTVAVEKQCGPLPPKPAWMVHVDSLDARNDALANDQRDAEEQARGKALEASGLSAAQYAQARERILNYYAEIESNEPIQQFGAKERKLLDAHRGDIQRLKRAL